MHELVGADAERVGDTLGYQAVAEAVAGHLHDAGEGLQGAADFDSKAPLLALSAQAALQEARMDSETPISRRTPRVMLPVVARAIRVSIWVNIYIPF